MNEPSHRAEAAEILRGLIDTITLTPFETDGRKTHTIDISGHLAGILRLAGASKRDKSGNGADPAGPDQQVKLVAGAGIELCLLARAVGLRLRERGHPK